MSLVVEAWRRAGLTDEPDDVEGGVGEDRCVGLI